MENQETIEPQSGPQYDFLSTTAHIAIYGGAAGGGKTFALLIEPLRHIDNPEFNGMIFRRTLTQVKNPGGLWDEATKIYPFMGALPKSQEYKWVFPGLGNQSPTMSFGHLDYEKDKFNYQGSQIPYIGFDELTHFSESQFFYMLGRNRSTAGIPGYVRGTCNPDPASWVRSFIDWWIGEDGYPIPERSGVIRWFLRRDDTIVWRNSQEELIEEFGEKDGSESKSVTFIPSSVYDNRILLQKDPSYVANLKALPKVEREQLLHGNWNIRAAAGEVFRREWFPMVDTAPLDVKKTIRYWDRAGTEEQDPNKKGPDWTVGLRMSITHDGICFVESVVRDRKSPGGVEDMVRNTTAQDGKKVSIGIEQDPGQAGKAEANYYVRQLAGYDVRCYPVSKDKVTRAKPVSAQAEAGNIKVVRGKWNEEFFKEIENFPAPEFKDDQVDALSGAFNALTGKRDPKPRITSL